MNRRIQPIPYQSVQTKDRSVQNTGALYNNVSSHDMSGQVVGESFPEKVHAKREGTTCRAMG